MTSNWGLLLVVLCFAVLYLGVVMVFMQIRGLRDELKIQNSPSHFPDPTLGDRDNDRDEELDERLSALQRDLMRFQENISQELETIPGQLQSDLEAIHRQLRYLDRSLSMLIGVQGAPASPSEMASRDREDAHSEAKRLLQNGVPEERVIDQTGLSVEEVSLIRRMQQLERG